MIFRDNPVLSRELLVTLRANRSFILQLIYVAVLGLVVEWLLIRPLYGKDPLYSLLLTFGLAYIFEDVTRVIWGAQSGPFQVPGWLMTSLSIQYFVGGRLHGTWPGLSSDKLDNAVDLAMTTDIRSILAELMTGPLATPHAVAATFPEFTPKKVGLV